MAAEELVRHVRNLLDHGDAIEKALKRSVGKEEARSRLGQIERLVESLEIELWRAATPDQTLGMSIATGLKAALGAIGLTVAAAVTQDVYEALTTAEAHADKVIECVVPVDSTGPAGVASWVMANADEVVIPQPDIRGPRTAMSSPDERQRPLRVEDQSSSRENTDAPARTVLESAATPIAADELVALRNRAGPFDSDDDW